MPPAVGVVIVVQLGEAGEDGAVLEEEVHHILYLAVVHLAAHHEGVLLLEGSANSRLLAVGVPVPYTKGLYRKEGKGRRCFMRYRIASMPCHAN